MPVNRDIQEQLKQRLINDHRSWLWSYNENSLQDISSDIIIEKYLLRGNEHDWKLLKVAFPRNSIKRVWEENGAFSGLSLRHERIASYFFDISNPRRYIERKNRENIKAFERSY